MEGHDTAAAAAGDPPSEQSEVQTSLAQLTVAPGVPPAAPAEAAPVEEDAPPDDAEAGEGAHVEAAVGDLNFARKTPARRALTRAQVSAVFDKRALEEDPTRGCCYLCCRTIFRALRSCTPVCPSRASGRRRVADCICGAWEVEHVVAYSSGPTDALHVVDNMLPACFPCNRVKGSKTLEECVRLGLFPNFGVGQNGLTQQALLTLTREALRRAKAAEAQGGSGGGGEATSASTPPAGAPSYLEDMEAAFADAVASFPFAADELLASPTPDDDWLEVGAGGSAHVYAVPLTPAAAQKLGSTSTGKVAIKVFPDVDPRIVRHVTLELGFARDLPPHPCIVGFRGAFRCDLGFCLAFDYCHATLSRRTDLSRAARVNVCWDVATALSHLHANKLLHRDVKPANVLLLRDEGLEINSRSRSGASPASSSAGGIGRTSIPLPASCVRGVLADLGLVQVADAAHTVNVGSAGYRPPEARSGTWSYSSDIWSFGALLKDVVRRYANEQELAEAVDVLVEGCMQPAPSARLDMPALLTAMRELKAKWGCPRRGDPEATEEAETAAVAPLPEPEPPATAEAAAAAAEDAAGPAAPMPVAVEEAADGGAAEAIGSCTVVLGRGSSRAGQVCGRALPCRYHKEGAGKRGRPAKASGGGGGNEGDE